MFWNCEANRMFRRRLRNQRNRYAATGKRAECSSSDARYAQHSVAGHCHECLRSHRRKRTHRRARNRSTVGNFSSVSIWICEWTNAKRRAKSQRNQSARMQHFCTVISQFRSFAWIKLRNDARFRNNAWICCQKSADIFPKCHFICSKDSSDDRCGQIRTSAAKCHHRIFFAYADESRDYGNFSSCKDWQEERQRSDFGPREIWCGIAEASICFQKICSVNDGRRAT